MLPETEVGVRAGRIFVSTNRNCMPYYLVDKDLDLSSKLGKKLSTNDMVGASYTTTAEQGIRMVNGKLVFWNYYCQRGRYAFINRTRLTLVDFELIISQDAATTDDLELVTCGQKSFRVNSSFLQEVERLKQSGSALKGNGKALSNSGP